MVTRSLLLTSLTRSRSNLHTLFTNNTNKACLPSQQLLGKQVLQQPSAHYFSKTMHYFMVISAYFFRHTAYFIAPVLFITSDGPPQSTSWQFRLYFLKFITFQLIPAKTNFSRLPILKISQKVQIISMTQIYGTV